MTTNLKPNIDKLFIDMMYDDRGYDHGETLWSVMSRMGESLELTKMTDKIDRIKSSWREEPINETLSESESEE
jgi:hypothetical protein